MFSQNSADAMLYLHIPMRISFYMSCSGTSCCPVDLYACNRYYFNSIKKTNSVGMYDKNKLDTSLTSPNYHDPDIRIRRTRTYQAAWRRIGIVDMWSPSAGCVHLLSSEICLMCAQILQPRYPSSEWSIIIDNISFSRSSIYIGQLPLPVAGITNEVLTASSQLMITWQLSKVILASSFLTKAVNVCTWFDIVFRCVWEILCVQWDFFCRTRQ